jgi:multidrug efflux pump subunit AcrA (membrane-fusion protein)
MKKILNIILSCCISALIVACGGAKKEESTAKSDTAAITNVNEVLALGRVEPEGQIVALSSEVTGIVTQVFKNEGDTVTQGEPIIAINPTVKQAEIALAQSKIATKQAQIQVDIAAIAKAKTEIANLQLNVERSKRLVAKGAETKQTLDDAETKLNIQLEEITRLQKTLQVTTNSIAELGKEVALRTSELARLTVKAPANGILLNMEAQAGESIAAGSSFADFAPKGDLVIVCEVDELYADNVAIGNKVNIRNQGSTVTIAGGEVIYTAPYLKKKSLFSDAVGDSEDRRVREVKIKITSGKKLLINSRLEAAIQLTNTAK